MLDAVVEEGPHRLGALAEWAGTTDATASRAVEASVGARLVERCVDPADRRAIRVSATSAERRLMRERRLLVVELLSRPLAGLDATARGRFSDVLGELNDRLAQPAAMLQG